MTESVEVAQQRYLAAAHAMQSGVAAKMNIDPTDTEPKHLRVGINSSMAEFAALVELLLEKGIIAREEWYTRLADSMEREKKLYEEELRAHYGDSRITLA